MRARGYLPAPDACDTAEEQAAYYDAVEDALADQAQQAHDERAES